MKILSLLLVVFILPVASAASITGTTYDISLKPHPTTIVINSTPAQTFVAGDGTYSLDVSRGVYLVTVNDITPTGLEIKQEQVLEVVDENGSYTLDFILFPSLDEIEEPVLGRGDDVLTPDSEKSWLTIPLLLMGLVLIILLIVLMRSRHSADEPEIDDVKKRVFALIKAHRRISQKELRKSLPESESAVSLAVTELANEGCVEKIKKGRSNVLIFKK